MVDLQSSTGAAALAAAVGSHERAPHYYGGGSLAGTGSEALLLKVVVDYLNHHPHERGGLADELRALLISPSSSARYLPLIYSQGSHSIDALLAGSLAHAPAVRHCDFSLLETYRSDVASLARFSQRVDHATWYLYVAVDTQAERHLWHKPGVSVRRSPKSWYSALARHSFARWKTARAVLSTEWSIPEISEPLYRTAFWSLCELTPADSQLKLLFEQDRPRACRELVRHVDAYAEQLLLATDLAEAMADDEGQAARSEDEMRLDAIQGALLDRAGERLTLTQAAERLGITRQALHKKIKAGTALGLMMGETFVLPSVQLVDGKSGTAVVAHLKDVLSLFTGAGAGAWSALQYLVEPDPALGGKVPLDLLKAGETAAVVAAARGYLGLDEGR